MKTVHSLSALATLLSVVGAVKRYDNGTAPSDGSIWVTETVTGYTTICPSPTTIVQNNQTYIVTTSTTLTITNCPCTISTIVPSTLPTSTTQTLNGTTSTIVGIPTTATLTGSNGVISTSTGLIPIVPPSAPSTTAAGGGGGGGAVSSTATKTTGPSVATGAVAALRPCLGVVFAGGVMALLL